MGVREQQKGVSNVRVAMTCRAPWRTPHKWLMTAIGQLHVFWKRGESCQGQTCSNGNSEAAGNHNPLQAVVVAVPELMDTCKQPSGLRYDAPCSDLQPG